MKNKEKSSENKGIY